MAHALVEAPVSTARAIAPVQRAHRPPVLVHLPGGEINLMLAVQRPSDAPSYETLKMLPEEPIQDLKLLLHNRGWFSSKQNLVFGDRELLELVTQQIQDGSDTVPSHLHVYAKLADVEGMDITTMLRTVSFNNQMHKSSRMGSEAKNLPGAAGTEQSLQSLAVVPARSDLQRSLVNGQSVIHLLVHKAAKMNWRHVSEDKFELTISSSETVDSLMAKLAATNNLIEADKHQVVFDGQVLSGSKPLASYGISKGSVLELVPVSSADADELLNGSPPLSSPAHGLYENWQKARAGLAEGQPPKLAKAGTGGAYFLQDVDGRNVAVFKPEDEEPMAVNNPKGSGHSGEGLRKGTRPGEGAVREVVAYVLDHEHFAGVPPTALVSCFVNESSEDDVAGDSGSSNSSGGSSQKKVGSLQQYVFADYDCEERGSSSFPVTEVHKLCVLDIRLANTDRNGSNILACMDGDSWRLVPIDHGYCLPASFEDISFEWLYWPQAQQPFDQRTLDYIANLDAQRDISILRAHGLQLRPECLRVLRVCTMLLKKAAARGLTPFQIGSIMCREGDEKSPLERLHADAMRMVRGAGGDDHCYFSTLASLMDEYLEECLLASDELLY